MTKLLAAHSRSQHGLALVEFALALPLLMMLLIGLIEVGRYAYFTIEVANAAHAGAQYASISPNATATSIAAAVTADGANSIATLTVQSHNVCGCWNGSAETALTTAQCTAPCATGTGQMVSYAQVSVTGNISPLFNYGALGLPSQWTVSRTATMRVTTP